MISAPLQKAFMLLLRQGLWDRQEDCSALFPLDEKEWNEIHSMARKQTVQGIIYDGIRLLPTEAVPPRKVLLGWMVEVDTLERVNRQHRETIKALQQIYVQSPSIPFLLLKGIGTADFYPHPEHRIAGDIDLWFGNKTQTEQANQRMEKLGLPVKRGTNGEASCLINRVLITSQQADRVAQPFPPKRNPPMGSGGLYQQPRQTSERSESSITFHPHIEASYQ